MSLPYWISTPVVMTVLLYLAGLGLTLWASHLHDEKKNTFHISEGGLGFRGFCYIFMAPVWYFLIGYLDCTIDPSTGNILIEKSGANAFIPLNVPAFIGLTLSAIALRHWFLHVAVLGVNKTKNLYEHVAKDISL